MLKTLAWKEARELMPLAILALVVEFGWLAAARTPIIPSLSTADVIPFYNDSACTFLLLVAGFAAAAFGFWQTSRESSRGTLQFLLHRPVSRDALFATKLAVGLSVYLVATGLPLGVYTLWAATPGTHASPFLWSLAGRVWLNWAILPLLYFGGFLSGLCPGRWFGTRMFPLAASLLILSLVRSSSEPTWYVLPVCAIAVAVQLLATMNLADTRDYS